MATKKWYKSRTLWVNAISMASILVLQFAGVELTANETGAALVVVNAIMRVITKAGLE